MKPTRPILPKLSTEDRTPVVDSLLEFIQWQATRLEDLENEIQGLKQQTKKPRFKASGMDDQTNGDEDKEGEKDQPSGKESQGNGNQQKRPRRKKKVTLVVHDEKIIQPDSLPDNSCFKGYRDILVQDLVIQPHTTRYRLAQYETPNGTYISGQLPGGIRGKHWGSTLHSFILYQYHHQHVTQPLLLEQLREIGIDISSGQLSHMITENLETFHAEKDSLLSAGLACASYIQTDDTGARHAGQTGYCTHIGNELFAWFKSTESKSRINFLTLLQQGKEKHYVMNAGALAYMEQHKLPLFVRERLETAGSFTCDDQATLTTWLETQAITGPRHQRIITEGALMGGLLQQGIPTHLAIMSDDAGQFNVFDHALCWIHTERLIHRLIPLNDQHKKAVDWIRSQVWAFYADLKAYKKAPDEATKQRLLDDFDHLFQTRTSYETLNQLLKRINKNKHELLRVLDRPELPLHNNLSERDIRDYVKKRKISGSTRSEAGRRCRDTFASLKKTCRKLGISFWQYLMDRQAGINAIAPLHTIVEHRAAIPAASTY